MEKEMNDIDTFIGEELEKDVTQETTVDSSVETHLGEMGFLWDRVQKKFIDDKICFGCKTEMDFENDAKVHLVEANKVEKGVIAFVAICDKCFDKQLSKDKQVNGEKK